MPRFFDSLSISQEMISRQTDGFPEKFEAAITDCMTELFKTKASSLKKDNPALVNLTQLINTRFGINVLIVTNSTLAAAWPVYLNTSTTMLLPYERGLEYERVMYEENRKHTRSAVTGSVDFEHAKVSGGFSEVTCCLYINFSKCRRFWSVKQIAGIMLHEIGHLFYSFAFSSRMNAVNMILDKLTKKKLDTGKVDLDLMFVELSKVNPDLKKEDLEELTIQGKLIPGPRVLEILGISVHESNRKSAYNNNSFEMLADHFAASFGYSEALGTALQHFTTKRYSPMWLLTVTADVIGVVRTLLFLFIPWTIARLFAILIGFGLYNKRASWFFGPPTSNSANTMLYDYDPDRTIRLKNHLIEQLKDTDLSPKDTKIAIEQIRTLDNIAKTQISGKTIVAKLYDAVDPLSRQATKDLAYQQLLEQLSANPLYVEAAKLRTT